MHYGDEQLIGMILDGTASSKTRSGGIVAGVLWKDGSSTAGWSNMDVGNLASLILILDEAQRRRTLGEGEI